jgi:type IV pilus assembly protein PilA
MGTPRTDLLSSRLRRTFWIPLCFLAVIFVLFLFLTPTFHDTGIAKNEATAAGSLRKIYELENAYSAAHPDNGFACQLKQLQRKEDLPEMYGNFMNLLAGEWVGYKFEIVGCLPQANGVFGRYQVTAVPITPSVTGVRAFCTDQSGNVFYDPNGSASECLAARRPLP